MRHLPSTVCLLLAASCLPWGVARSAEPPATQPLLHDIARAVDPAELHATIAQLVAFGTRHTLSDTASDSRGIGAARRWVVGRLAELARRCGGCLQIETPAQTFAGPRIPEPTSVMDVVAIQRGATDPNRVILITAHLDSRVTDPLDASSDAPGANDDGSGVAAVLEAARILSRHRFGATLVYGVLSGEEQNLYGGTVLADYAQAQGWQVEVDLNNDIIGNSVGGNGVRDAASVRVFSEGTKSRESPEQASRRRYNGGEVDSPSRNVARYMESLVARQLPHFKVQMVYRTDRYGRGGDQVAFLEHGYPAVRLTESHENYAHQHQDLRTEHGVRYGDTLQFVDFPYLAQVTRVNLLTLASLAMAPAPPRGVSVEGAVSSATTVKWQSVAGAAGYRVYWRGTTEPQWSHSRYAAADAVSPGTLVLPNRVIDNLYFGVAAVSADGYESPAVFPGDAGEF